VKKFFCVAFIALALGSVFAQTNTPPHQWNVTLKIVDENGNPVSGANTRVGYFVNSQPASFAGLTDTNGIFTASHSAVSDFNELGFEANKSGFYATRMECMLYPPYDPVKWDITQTLALKKVGKPIAMYAKWVNENPPILNQSIGYDLMVGDWVSVGHKGINADIIFKKKAYRKSGTDYEYKLEIVFPKVGDGIQIYTISESEAGSSLRSPHQAPVDGYRQTLSKERSAHPGQPSKNDDDPNRIYLFRVRTALDHQGNVVSAYYGKIYGDFMQFTYYLNPTSNDQNIEFDPKQNLLGELRPFEQVTAP
jgi:hypothetical protein